MFWFELLKTTCDPDAGISVTDDNIENAIPFDGWNERYLEWPESLWYAPHAEPFKVPCMDVAKNAWHIKKLAIAMQIADGWIGPQLDIDKGLITDGNHRVRACKYLYDRCNVVIQDPRDAIYA